MWIITGISLLFFFIDFICYFIATNMEKRPLWDNYPGSGFVELFKAIRKKKKNANTST